MASRCGFGSNKRHRYFDLDAPNPSSKDPWDTKLYPMSSNPSTTSSGSKKPKKARNPKPVRKRVQGGNIEVCLTIFQVIQNTTNVFVGTFEAVHKNNPGQRYDTELEDLLHKLKIVEAFCQQFFGQRNKEIPSQANVLKSAFEQHLQGGVVWHLQKVKLIKMHLQRMDMEKYVTLELLQWLAFQQIVISLHKNQKRQPSLLQ